MKIAQLLKRAQLPLLGGGRSHGILSTANGKDVFRAFMDLKKPYDTIDRHGMWQMLRVYGVGGKLLKAVQSFYIDIRSGWEIM